MRGVPFLGAPIVRIIVLWPLVLGNYHLWRIIDAQ